MEWIKITKTLYAVKLCTYDKLFLAASCILIIIRTEQQNISNFIPSTLRLSCICESRTSKQILVSIVRVVCRGYHILYTVQLSCLTDITLSNLQWQKLSKRSLITLQHYDLSFSSTNTLEYRNHQVSWAKSSLCRHMSFEESPHRHRLKFESTDNAVSISHEGYSTRQGRGRVYK